MGEGLPEQVPVEATEVSTGWVEAIASRHFAGMWWRMTGNFRRGEAWRWVWANRDHPRLQHEDLEALARELSQLRSEHPLRDDFESGRLDALQEIVPEGFVADGSWGYASNRRLTPDGYDITVLMRVDGEMMMFNSPTWLTREQHGAVAVVTCQIDGEWYVAGYNNHVADPGTPPSYRQVYFPDDEDDDAAAADPP